jgi:adenylate kinase
MARGDLLTDEMLIAVAKERLATLPAKQKIIFDGIPRRLGQAEFLLDYLEEQKREKPVTIFIDLSKEEAVQRLLLRAGTEGRADDTPEAIETRLRAYEESVKPTIEYLKTRTAFIAIDGGPSVDDVAKNIEEALSPLFADGA